MANTPYIDLVKPAGTDKALISVLNANSDKIDSAVGGVQDALAIVCNGNTHGAITSGQYVYVRAHETLQEGLYKANSNIAANAALTSSNLTANSSGGLNALNEQIANIDTVTMSGCTLVSSLSGNINAFKFGNIVCLFGYATITTDIIGYGTEMFTVPNDYKPSASRSVGAETKYGGTTGLYNMQVDTSGKFKTAHGGGAYSEYLRVYCIYQVD